MAVVQVDFRWLRVLVIAAAPAALMEVFLRSFLRRWRQEEEEEEARVAWCRVQVLCTRLIKTLVVV